MERLMAAGRGGVEEARHLRESTPEGLPKARRMLMQLVDEAARQVDVPLSRVVLGGFSQGAMLATDATLRLDEPPAALCILSGTLLVQKEWAQLAPRRAGLKVFQSHGRRDAILPFANATALRDLLTAAGLDVDFLPFDGEHTIPLEALERVGDLLSQYALPL
jgi:phospholipase/carboxylesterase